MILVDSSVWVEHLRKGNSLLGKLLQDAQVACHPFVIGELACGNLKKRKEILVLLGQLPRNVIADHSEVLELVEVCKLVGKGIGWIDAHLLASSLLTRTLLWTLDRRLANAASSLGLDFG